MKQFAPRCQVKFVQIARARGGCPEADSVWIEMPVEPAIDLGSVVRLHDRAVGVQPLNRLAVRDQHSAAGQELKALRRRAGQRGGVEIAELRLAACVVAEDSMPVR